MPTVKLLTEPPADAARLLGMWAWRIGARVRPLAVTRFGDWFLQQTEGSVHFLDINDGSYEEVAPSVAEWQALLGTEEGHLLLMCDMVLWLYDQGQTLEPGQCFGYAISPLIGGSVESDNVKVYDLGSYVAIQASLHQSLLARS